MNAAPENRALAVTGLWKWFGNHVVLQGIDLEVSHGEVIVVFGRSGSGKSTLLRCINFLEEPSAGTIEVAGIRVQGGGHRTRAKRERIRQLRIRTGMVFQDFNLFPHRSALDNIIEGPLTVLGKPQGGGGSRGTRVAARGWARGKGRSVSDPAVSADSSSGLRSRAPSP